MSTSLEDRAKILIVDAYKVNADVLGTIFEQAGFETFVFYSAEEALASAIKPHVALIEFILIGMNGLDYAVRLRQRCPNCAILCFSGQVADHISEEARARGYIVFDKPVKPEVLIEAAKQALLQRDSY